MWKNTSKNQVQQYMQQNPYRLLALSFFATMTIGTILLMLPISNAQGHSTTLVDHNSVILSDAVFDLPCFIVPAECFGTSHLGSRIAFFLLCKHKFQVDFVIGIILDNHTILGTLPEKIVKVFACFHNLIYRVF